MPTKRLEGAVFLGKTSKTNCVLSVPGPEPSTSNRAVIYAVLLAVRATNPDVSWMIFTNSEIWCENLRAEEAKKMSQEGSRNTHSLKSYITLAACPWGEHKTGFPVIDTPKVSTALPENAPLKTPHCKAQSDKDGKLQWNPEHHRGREKMRVVFGEFCVDELILVQNPSKYHWKI
ncbi:hypothetical protein B0H19DRAFT_1066561 [Mycena capillaripes]|nr:hypothetical protein B0H19DRAFT_1066561 [Mycena capillaripes]